MGERKKKRRGTERANEMESEDKEEKWEMKDGKGKGVHDNGKRSNLQILSETTPFPVQRDVQLQL